MTAKEYLINHYHHRLYYLSTQLSYLTASNGNGPWDKEEVEAKLAYTKERLKELSSYA